MPSLPQSRTGLIRGISGVSGYSDYTDNESLLTVSRGTSRNTSDNEEDSDSDASDSSSTSFSSDWDTRTIISTVSTVLPPRPKTHQKMNIKPYLSQQFLIEFKKDPQIDITYDLYELFYPFTNLQSLLFSQSQPYIQSDYKKNKAFGNNLMDETKQNETPKHNVKMNWNDTDSINRIQGLITKLLSSSGGNQGIKEEELYLMFSSPSPTEIIEALRFGSLSVLCDIHMDRFGRRSYHYRQSNVATGHKRRQSQLHFYNHSRCPSNMFAEGDIVGLSDFIEEEAKPEISDRKHSRNPSVTTKIHYHDNDVVMVTNKKTGKIDTEFKWQNYAIHSYLYDKTRALLPQNQRKPPIQKYNTRMTYNYNSYTTRTRANGQLLKYNKNGNIASKYKAPTIIIKKQSVSKKKLISGVKKAGYLEKENIRSNILSKQWVTYWCILRNKQLLLYKNRGESMKKAIECIDLNKIGIPILASYDTINKYFTFKLDVVDSMQCYSFRTRSGNERNGWISEIDAMLDYENNVGCKHRKKNVENEKRNQYDKTDNCLIM